MEATKEDYVLRTVEERGVRLIRLWFTDVLGQLKSLAISPAELEAAFEEGLHFDGSAIDGFSRVQESDVLGGAAAEWRRRKGLLEILQKKDFGIIMLPEPY